MSFGCYLEFGKTHCMWTICIYLNSGSMECININYNSVSFSYQDCPGTCACYPGVRGPGYVGGYAGIMRGMFQSESYVQFGSHFCPHCRISNNRGHLPTNGLIVSPLKKHWCRYVSSLRCSRVTLSPGAVVFPLMASNIVHDEELAVPVQLTIRTF